jgi:hypothetical protein
MTSIWESVEITLTGRRGRLPGRGETEGGRVVDTGGLYHEGAATCLTDSQQYTDGVTSVAPKWPCRGTGFP